MDEKSQVNEVFWVLKKTRAFPTKFEPGRLVTGSGLLTIKVFTENGVNKKGRLRMKQKNKIRN